jgi:hypothetical protein
MGLEKWSKAEMALQRILSREPWHDVALYQLSQVYLEQNKTRPALKAIRSAAKNGCTKNNDDQDDIFRPAPAVTSCIWGPRCTSKAQLCTQIVIQEADILRAMRKYKMAAQVQLLGDTTARECSFRSSTHRQQIRKCTFN